MFRKILPMTIILILSGAIPAGADTGGINPADTAWILISTALVMIMTPGLALFYGGMVRRKNVLSMIMQSFFILCLISVQWVLWGYSLAFGPDRGGVIGELTHLGLAGVGMEPSGTIPHFIFMMFQGMFAVITVALITGTFAERMKFTTFFVFSLLWATLVYDPLCHWVWGGGWLMKLGVLDFAGGTVVHISSGVSALVAAVIIGKRKGHPEKIIRPHNLPLTVIGTALLWFGWFGFNAGSALAADGLAALAFVNTNTAAAAAGLMWLFIEWAQHGKPTVLGLCSGAVAGLATITPAAGFVSPLAAIIIGLGAGILCFYAVSALKSRLGYDDSLDVFGIHGVGSTWGMIATGLFCSSAINPGGADGLFSGNPGQLIPQLIGVLAAWILAGGVTFIVLKVLEGIMGLRVSKEEEEIGLDLALHSESGYTVIE